MLIKERFTPSMELQRDTIICPDGGKIEMYCNTYTNQVPKVLIYLFILLRVILGEISLDWANDEISKNLPNDAPVLGILHTITGSARQNIGFMRYAASRGWRSCVLNRRGHSGMP